MIYRVGAIRLRRDVLRILSLSGCKQPVGT